MLKHNDAVSAGPAGFATFLAMGAFCTLCLVSQVVPILAALLTITSGVAVAAALACWRRPLIVGIVPHHLSGKRHVVLVLACGWPKSLSPLDHYIAIRLEFAVDAVASGDGPV